MVNGVNVTLATGLRTPFPRYWLSAFLSDFGDGVRLAAFPLLASRLSHSPAAVAAAAAVQNLPWLVGAGAGIVVDRTDGRRLMVTVDLVRAAVITALALAIAVDAVSMPVIYVAAFATGVGSALRDSAAMAYAPRLAEPAELDRANSRLVIGRIVGYELAGPAAGSWLFGVAAVMPFAGNASALGLSALLLLTLPSVFRTAPGGRSDRDVPPTTGSLRRDLGDGLRWLRAGSDVKDVIIASGVICFLDAAWFALLVLYVIRILHRQPGVYGLLLAVGALGGLLTGAVGARVFRRLGTWRSLLLSGIVMAGAQALLGLSADLIIAAAMIFAGSAAFALFNIATVTMIQRSVPVGMLGRVTGIYLTATRGAEAVGAIGGGVLAATAGIRAPMLAGAVPTAGVMIFLSWRHRTGSESP
jgi:MFS family permease